MTTEQIDSKASIISAAQLLEHWQGHRKLTRKVIEAFPEDAFYNYSIGGMRTFAEQTMELIGLTAPGIHGIVSGDWTFQNPPINHDTPAPPTIREVLALWDFVTAELDKMWPQIPEDRFQETDAAFGMYTGPIFWTIFYLIDNEIHHRAQAYVYLRSLGITPPPFWDRGVTA